MESATQSQTFLAILEMVRVIHALMLREIKTKFANQKLGYLWAFIEAILMVSVFVALFSLRGRTSPGNLGLELFMITGFVPFFLFRHTMSSVGGAIKANKSFLAYPQVQVNDVILARFFLEYATSFIVLIIMVAGVHMLNIDEVNINFPLGVLAGFTMLALFGLGLGLCISSLAPIFPSVQTVAQTFVGRPLFFLSGVFYSADIIPETFRPYLLLNPLFHCIELIRFSFQNAESQYLNLAYAIKFLVLLVFSGLLMQRALYRYSLTKR